MTKILHFRRNLIWTAIVTVANRAWPWPHPNCARQQNRALVVRSCDCATAVIVTSGRSLSSTTVSLSASLNQRRFDQLSALNALVLVKLFVAEESLVLVLAALLNDGRALG